MSCDVMLPAPCRCGSIKGAVSGGTIDCKRCGKQRHTMSDITARFIVGVTKHFGDPAQIVLRKPDALAAIAQQNEFLKRKLSRSGENWADIITNSEIVPVPIDAGLDNDESTSVEEGNEDNDLH